MSAILWLLAVLRKLGASLTRLLIKALLPLLSVASRAIKGFPSDPTGNGFKRTHQASDTSDGFFGTNLFPRGFSTADGPPISFSQISPSLVPPSLYPYQLSGPSASRSSQDIGTLPIQDSYPLRNLSPQDSRLRSRSPSPMESPRGSVVDISFSSAGSTHSSEGLQAAIFPQSLGEVDSDIKISIGTPEAVMDGRYSKGVFIPKEPTQYTIAALTFSPLPLELPKGWELPEGWTPFIHSEGARYFCHKEKQLFTDSNILNPEIFGVITQALRTIEDFVQARGIILDADVHLVLDVSSPPERECKYYFVNIQTRWIFWMDDVDSNMFSITDELKGITSASSMHTRHEIVSQYWLHCSLFPKREPSDLTDEKVDEFRDVVLASLEDRIISPTSTVPWTVEQLTHMLHLADGFSKLVGSKSTHSSASLCRLMHLFARERVYNFHGEQCARLYSTQSVYECSTTQKPTLLVGYFNPLLFYRPDAHLIGLKAVCTDGLIRMKSWPEFVLRLSIEWQELTNYGVFVLNANVSFLSIQSVDQGGNLVVNRSPAQIASYLSILISMGGIIVALLLMQHNRHRDRESPAEAANFIAKQTHPTLGLEKLAILYSLPYAMFMWSLILFLAAFSFNCFHHSSLVTHIFVALLWIAVAALILWCIYNGCEAPAWVQWLKRLDSTSDAEESEPTLAEQEPPKPAKRRWWLSKKESDQVDV